MRRNLLLGALFLGVSTVARAQAEGPLHAAVLRVSRTTPLMTYGTGYSADQWASVIRLKPGTEINLTRRGGSAARRTMVTADDTSLILVNLTPASLPDAAKKALVTMATRAPEKFRSLQSDGVRMVDRSITVSADGVFVGTTKVAELREVVEEIPRDGVQEIHLESHHGSVGWTVVGGGAGFFAGLVAGMGLAEAEGNHCTSSHCSHVGSTAALVGLPAAGAVIAYFATKHERHDVVYLAPKQ